MKMFYKIEKINKFYNNLFEVIKAIIKYRQHPLVFNVFDNLCENAIFNIFTLYVLH